MRGIPLHNAELYSLVIIRLHHLSKISIIRLRDNSMISVLNVIDVYKINFFLV